MLLIGYVNADQNNHDYDFDYLIEQPYMVPRVPLVSFQKCWECLTAFVSPVKHV